MSVCVPLNVCMYKVARVGLHTQFMQLQEKNESHGTIDSLVVCA